MSGSRDGSSSPWASLTQAKQFRAAVRVSRRLDARWRGKGPNVVGVGAGFRVRGGRIAPEVVIQVMVTRKWRRRRTESLPLAVPAYVRRGKRRLRCLIPTDIDPVGDGGPQAEVDVGGGLRALCDPYPPVTAQTHVRGAFAALVERVPSDGHRYLVGCHHVLTCSMICQQFFGGWDPMPGSRAQTPAGAAIGRTVRWTNLTSAVNRYGMGAALVQVAAGVSVPPAGVGGGLTRVAQPGDALGALALQTPRAPVACALAALTQPLTLPYGDTAITFGELVRYLPASSTRDGDSGSPLVTSEGVLVGMHIWGGTIRDPSGQVRPVGYGVPAWELFRPGLFAGLANIRLVTA